jgi:glycosyltransferase involved in cell wall biosynthesis
MRITLLTAHISPLSAGVWNAIAQLGAALSVIGVATTVVGLADRHVLDEVAIAGVPITRCRVVGPDAFGFAPSLLAAIRTSHPDLMHAHGLWMYPSWASLRWARRRRGPIVVSPHGMLDPWALRRSAIKKRLVGMLFEWRHLEHAVCLHATSILEAQHFRAAGLRQPIAVIPNGVEVPTLAERQSARPAGARRRLLFLSRLHPKKGLDLLLHAWSVLAPEHPAWELVVAGPGQGDHRKAVHDLANSLQLERFVLENAKYGRQKTELLLSADLFVLPTYSENFGLVIAEALAHAIPVVTTRAAPWQGLVERRCGWWTDPTLPGVLDALCEAMALERSELEAMGARGRDWMCRDFTWRNIALDMSAVYRWCLGGGPPPACVIME